MDTNAAKSLLRRYLEGDASQDELILVEQWYQAMAEAGDWDWAEGEQQQLQTLLENRLLERIAAQPAEIPSRESPAVVRPMPFWGKRALGVAAVLFLLAVGVWLLFIRQRPQSVTAGENPGVRVKPHNTAILTLAGGKTIPLGDSAVHWTGRQGDVILRNDSGQVVYVPASEKASEIVNNTLATPTGSQYRLLLPDGTKVWLNASSSITYPTAFAGSQRRVKTSGEVYFEVARQDQQPFIVQQGGMTVQVLGTSFDVNGYDDEAALRTTLLTGKVRVGWGAADRLIAPGGQAVIEKGGSEIRVNGNADIETIMAWKNGSFAFRDADIGSIMRQAARWYDIRVVYAAKIDKHFIADIPINVPLADFLKLLEATDQVHFRVEGKKVIVMP
ncbi:MAG TPA: FecR domain-containing protein [Puia sp.]|nr:FecR domain-containing protein [Puia sp.]